MAGAPEREIWSIWYVFLRLTVEEKKEDSFVVQTVNE